MHQSASNVGSLLLGLQTNDVKKVYNSDVLYLLNADEVILNKKNNQFIIYQGTHGGENSQFADVILPGAAYSEKDGSFVNLEGRVQRSYKASYPPGYAKEDWEIFFEISKKRGVDLGINSFEDLRNEMIEEYSILGNYDHLPSIDYEKINYSNHVKKDFKIDIDKIDYFQTNIIARSSKTMKECKLAKLQPKKTGTEN